MTDKAARAQRLEELFDAAFDLDAQARAQFLASTAVEPELRGALTELLRAAAAVSPLDRMPVGLAGDAIDGHNNHTTVGRRLGSYRLIRLIGEGGMGTVWLAERDEGDFKRVVAIKCPKTDLVTAQSRARFLREQRILARLQHPNIARLYDAGLSEDGVPFIVMEWIDGKALTHYCDEHCLGLIPRLKLFRKICAAVTHAHQNLILHRDVKPSNILVGADGEPKLLDFDIAKLLDESEPVTRSGAHFFTPEYAAPEQFNGDPVTTATDVYALGVVLYELLCGLRPRHRNQAGQFIPIPVPSEALQRLKKTSADASAAPSLQRFSEQRATTPDRLQKALQGDLDTIVSKALQEDPLRRYSSVQSLDEDIERFFEQKPIHAHKDSWTYRANKYLQRNAYSVSLSVMVAVAIATSAVISLYQAKHARVEATRAINEAARAQAVSDFLENLFEVSNIGLARNEVPSTQALLQDGTARIRTQFNDQPETKLKLLLLLGRIQGNLGLHEQAQELLTDAKKIADSNFSPKDEIWLRAQTQWALLLLKREDYVESERHITQAIDRYRAVNGNQNNPALAAAISGQAAAYRHTDRFDDAVARSQEALAMTTRLAGERDPKTLEELQALAGSLIYAHRMQEAETVYRSTAALSRELYGERHVQYAVSLCGLAQILARDPSKLFEAEALARQALTIAEGAGTESTPFLIKTLGVLGNSLMVQGKFDQAEPIYQRILATQSRLFHTRSDEVAEALYALSYISARRLKFQEQEIFARQALSIWRDKQFPPTKVARALTTLADALSSQERYPEAIATLKEALEIKRNAHGPDSEAEGTALCNLAEVELRAERPASALEHAERALRILSTKLPDKHRFLIATQIARGKALNELGKHAQSQEALMLVVTQLRTGSDNGPDTFADALVALGQAQLALGDTKNALANWNEALALQRRREPVNTHGIAQIEALIKTGEQRSE